MKYIIDEMSNITSFIENDIDTKKSTKVFIDNILKKFRILHIYLLENQRKFTSHLKKPD